MIWYTPTDKHDVRYMPGDIALYVIHLQTSTVRYTPADIALYDINPHACNPVRCGSHACQRLVSATYSRPPAVLRCAVLLHNNSSCSSHYTAYTHTPAEMVLYGIHLQTRTPYARSPSSCARAQRQVRLALRVWLPETDLLELSYLPETTLFEIR